LGISGLKDIKDLVMFADDGIVYMENKEREPKIENPVFGLILARNKSIG